MQRINTSTKAVDLHGAGKHGFTGGNPVGAIPATRLSQDWCNAVQEEIARAIEGAGIVLNAGANNQLFTAIQALIAASSSASMPDGTVGAPGLPFTSDLDTGFYRPSADVLAVSIGGAEKARFYSGGMRLPNAQGIKARNAANSADINVAVSDGSNNLTFGEDTNAAAVSIQAAGSVTIRTGGGNRLVVDSSGALQTGAAAAAAGYTAAGSITLPAGVGIRAKNTAKFWVNFNGSSAAIADSFNLTSVTRNATANYTANLANAVANANGACAPSAPHNAVPWPQVWAAYYASTTTVTIIASNTANGTVTDMNPMTCIGYGA